MCPRIQCRNRADVRLRFIASSLLRTPPRTLYSVGTPYTVLRRDLITLGHSAEKLCRVFGKIRKGAGNVSESGRNKEASSCILLTLLYT
jgi:hypothetical protein